MRESDPIQKGKLRDTIVNSLVYIPLFDKLQREELTLIAGHMNIFKLQQGDTVFKEGDKGDYVCFVVDGTLEVIKHSENGEAKAVATIPRGRSLGEMSIIDEFPRSATIQARTTATLATLTRRRFEFILDQHPEIGIKMLKELARVLSLNLRRTTAQLSDLGLMHQ